MDTIFNNPQHPYTKGLIASVPDMRYKKQRLYSIPGSVPKPGSIKQGCRFAARCEFVVRRKLPVLLHQKQSPQGHKTRCFLYDEKEVLEDDRAAVKS